MLLTPIAQSTPSLPSYEAVNVSGGALVAGTPVTVHSSGVGVVAAVSADNTKVAAGVVQADTGNGFVATVLLNGPLTLADWTAIAGTATLAARASYYLGTSGGIANVAPSLRGQVVQKIGVAVGPNTLDVQVGRAILL